MRDLAAEAVGTTFLLIAVVGSGIMAETLSQGNAGLALLANAIATGAALFILIETFGPVSGAHFNPAVTLVFLLRREIPPGKAAGYVLVQISAGVLGVLLAHLMFELPIWQLSQTPRSGMPQYVSEFIATFGLLMVILGGLSARPSAIPALVAAYITGAYWFTSSTSFANPAVTIARGFTDTFAGIDPSHVPLFIVMQLLAALVAVPTLGWLFGRSDA